MTAPLPPLGQDPSIVGAQQVRDEWLAITAEIRGNPDLTDLRRAQAIESVWNDANAHLTRLYRDLKARQLARIETLDKLVPIGPDIPAGASPADVAVLQQAFRAALLQARDLDRDGLTAMLADAERFDDDTLRRAVLTASVDGGYPDVVRTYTNRLGVTDQLNELISLREDYANQGMASLWAAKLFTPIPKPQEVDDIPTLQEERDRAAAQAAVRGFRATGLR